METKRKKCKVIMLPTDKETGLFSLNPTVNSEITYHYSIISKVRKHSIGDGFHLYITSDDEIKEGDWYLYGSKVIKSDDNSLLANKLCRKIIATTDKSLKVWSRNMSTLPSLSITQLELPQPSKAFIEKYCKVGGIDEVMVEYEVQCRSISALCTASTFDNGCSSCDYKLKVNSHNEITIRQKKTEFTHDDVTHALAYGYQARREGLSHHEALLNYKKANDLM